MRKWKWHIGSKMNKCEQVSKQAIKFIELDNECIIFHFKNFWHQEEIEFLSSKILAKLGQAKVLEIIQGADRENIRFTWKIEYYFSLNFDCYTQ
jgi:hypothetical protein